MIMPRGSGALLLPLNPVWMWATLFLAFGVNLIPLGRVPAMPDVLALTLVFWIVHQPLRVGIFTAFFFGVLMDVHDGAVLGQHALAYTLLGFASVSVHRRILWFPLWWQVAHVLPLFVAAHLVVYVLRVSMGGLQPGWTAALAPVFEAALWPLAHWWLLTPQRRPPDTDANRPL